MDVGHGGRVVTGPWRTSLMRYCQLGIRVCVYSLGGMLMWTVHGCSSEAALWGGNWINFELHFIYYSSCVYFVDYVLYYVSR